MRKLCLLVLAVVLLVPGLDALSQDLEPAKYEGTWYQMVNVDYKPGMRDKAMEYIAENFAPAGMASGTGPDMVLLHHTGHHDMTMLWKLDGGPADMEWETSPDDVKWLKAMMAQHGGPAEMDKVWQGYMDMVADVDVIVTRTWNPMAGDEGEGDGGGDDDSGDGE